MESYSNNPSAFISGQEKESICRNTTMQDVNGTAHKQAKEGGLLNADDFNNVSTLNLLDKRDDATIHLPNGGETKCVSLAISNKDDDLSESLASLPIRAPIKCLKKKLLVLDLNGLLVDIVSSPLEDYKPDRKVRRKSIFMRPFCLDFLKFCFERFEVGIWSSRLKKNIDAVIDCVLGDMKHKLLFCWDLSHCTLTQFNTLENRHKPLVFKELRKIWEKGDPELPWEQGYYNESNTLLLDDSPYKALLNPVHTAIFPYSYQYQNREDNSIGDGGDLRVYLEGLVEADNVQKFVEQHPFGQKFINEKSPSWGFYLEVMSTLSSAPTQKIISVQASL